MTPRPEIHGIICDNLRLTDIHLTLHDAPGTHVSLKTSVSTDIATHGRSATTTVGYEVALTDTTQNTVGTAKITHVFTHSSTIGADLDTPENLKAIFFDANRLANALTRERFLSLSAAAGMQPTILPIFTDEHIESYFQELITLPEGDGRRGDDPASPHGSDAARTDQAAPPSTPPPPAAPSPPGMDNTTSRNLG